MKRLPSLRMNLQKFAEPEPEPVFDDRLDEDEFVEPETEPVEPETEPTEPEQDVLDEPKEKPEPTDDTEWVKKRLARAEKAFERKFLEEVSGDSDGVQLERRELPKAAKLWNVLKHNPEISRQVDELLSKAGADGKLKSLAESRPQAQLTKMNSDFELKAAELELRYSDSVFKKHEEKIRDFADDEGLDISNPKTLKLAIKAWKADNAALLLAERTKTTSVVKEVDPTRKSAKLVGGRSPHKGQAIDYRKAQDKDILAHMGLKLFTDD